MRNLTILSGAGINIGVSQACPFACDLLNFSYRRISENVYQKMPSDIQDIFSPESFDFILGGLLTVNLAIERMKQDARRFNMKEAAFASLFRQPELQLSIVDAFEQIESQLTISLDQMIDILQAFDSAIDHVVNSFDSINYFTTNFDCIFDHILYGQTFKRRDCVTDFWRGGGSFNKKAKNKVKIHHLHGDIRYKPFKKTKYNQPIYKWPVIVVGDGSIKRSLIAGHESLTFYNERLRSVMGGRQLGVVENVLAIIGFGFRDEDEHIISQVKHALEAEIFDKVLLFDVEDRLASMSREYSWVSPNDQDLIAFLAGL